MDRKWIQQGAGGWKNICGGKKELYIRYIQSHSRIQTETATATWGGIQRLDYLKWLGIDAIWVSPVYPSPMVDLGYDVSDYKGIHPRFGTMADFDRLLAECHARQIKLIIDFVPNHTSDQHPWFQEARASRHSRHRDWYLWEDAVPGGQPPNNWLSTFGRGAWERDEATEQYY